MKEYHMLHTIKMQKAFLMHMFDDLLDEKVQWVKQEWKDVNQ